LLIQFSPRPTPFSDQEDDAASIKDASALLRRPGAALVEMRHVQYFSLSWRCLDGYIAGDLCSIPHEVRHPGSFETINDSAFFW
jgi:hypothetical protein